MIFINPAEEADFEMEMYNADAAARRCVATVSAAWQNTSMIRPDGPGRHHHRQCRKNKIPETYRGGRTATDRGCVTLVQVNMGQPVLAPMEVPVIAEATRETLVGPAVVDAPITVDGEEYRMTCVSMGNPHAIVFMNGVKDLDIEKIGPKFENHSCFPNRTNTEFVEILDRKNVFMRVWERGTGETLACGTGCCATAVACVLNGLTDDEITVKLLGGELHIRWDRKANLST